MRDNKRNYNLTIPIKRDSSLHKALLADAEDMGTKQLGVLASIRLAEYYEMKRRGHPAPDPEPRSHDDVTRSSLDEMLANAEDADEAFPL
jgi:hypothetical protein